MGKLTEYLARKFGVKVTPYDSPDAFTVGLTAVRVLPKNADRLAFTLTNLGPANCYFWRKGDVSATKGYLIAPSGGRVSLLADEDFTLVEEEIYVISAGAANAFAYTEMIAEGSV